MCNTVNKKTKTRTYVSPTNPGLVPTQIDYKQGYRSVGLSFHVFPGHLPFCCPLIRPYCVLCIRPGPLVHVWERLNLSFSLGISERRLQLFGPWERGQCFLLLTPGRTNQSAKKCKLNTSSLRGVRCWQMEYLTKRRSFSSSPSKFLPGSRCQPKTRQINLLHHLG